MRRIRSGFNIKDAEGNTPLHHSRETGVRSIEGLERLKTGGTRCLWSFSRNYDPGAVEEMIKAGADVNARNNRGETALHAYFPRPEDTALLLKAGADPNACDNNGNTPLHFCQDADSAKLLLQAGAQVNARNNRGETALHRAALPMQEDFLLDDDMIKVLIDAGADPLERDNTGRTPFHNHLRWTAVDAMELPIELAKRIIGGAADRNGRTPLHKFPAKFGLAVWVFVRFLKLDVNAKDNFGRTPLHYCSDKLTAKVLLRCGADPLIRDNTGKTALDCCVDKEIAKVLKSAMKKSTNKGD